MKTSISDTPNYRNICLNFSKHDNLFEKFKQDPNYTQILEHTSKIQAIEYISCIKNSKLDLSKIDKFRENDEQGSPSIEYYGDPLFDGISPSTIRYIKTLSDLVNTFKNLDGKKIIEIGVGYGGQCKLINDYFDIQSYHLIDLPEVLELSEKYLNKYNYSNISYGGELLNEYDLIISNYAITECDKNIQIKYIDDIISKSRHGYITANYISEVFNINSLSKEEFIKRINKDPLYINSEYPLTFSGNCVMIW